MFTDLINKEIRKVLFEIEDIEILLDGQKMEDWERGELIDERYKLKGKLDGLEFALETYQETE